MQPTTLANYKQELPVMNDRNDVNYKADNNVLDQISYRPLGDSPSSMSCGPLEMNKIHFCKTVNISVGQNIHFGGLKFIK